MDGKPTMRVVALLNQKGGVGKTTTTVNLGAALAATGLRTLLIDLDPQSNLSLHFGVESSADAPLPGTASLFADPPLPLAKCITRARENLWFVPADPELALAEGQQDAQRVLANALETVRGRFDVVLLDCPPGLGVLSVNALTAADEVIVPMQAHYLALRGLEKLLQTVADITAGLNPRLRCTGVVLCMHENQSSHGRAVVDEIRQHFEGCRGSDLPWSECRLLQPPIRRNIKLAEAPSFGKTIFDYDPKCAGADDYRGIAESLIAMWGERQSAGIPRDPSVTSA
ncbi:MAG: ParA family protein [Planctomycetes bacterium]|nr:ParA family protein [Planctomycetota bacterium]